MKVAHIDVEKSWRGGQQQAVYLYEEMLKAGYETVFVCKQGSELEKYLKKTKHEYITVPFAGELDILSGFLTALYLKRNKCDICHLHSSHSLTLGLWVKLFLPRLKLVASRRVDVAVGKNFLSFFKYSTPKLDSIIAVSESIKNVLINNNIPPEKIKVIHSGVNTGKHLIDDTQERKAISSTIRVKWQIPQESLIVGTIAALAGTKDYPNLLSAAAIIAKQRADVSFLAVGDGVMLQEMQKKAAEQGLNDRFIFTGRQDRIGDYLNTFDIFVLASKKEGLGTSLIDAQAVGLPVIGTVAGGIPEIINDGIDGLLVPARNPQALAQAVLKLSGDSELRAQLGSNARINAQRFDKKLTFEKTIRLYEQLTDQK